MYTLTCPFCNEPTFSYYSVDTGDLVGELIAYKCNNCERVVYVHEYDERVYNKKDK